VLPFCSCWGGQCSERWHGFYTSFLLFLYFLHGFLDCSVLLDLADKVKGVTHSVTGRRMPFFGGLCSRAFLPPGAAAYEYLCTVSHLPADFAAHSEAAMLRRSRNARRSRVLASGVVIGVCNACAIPCRSPRARTSKRFEACTSQRHATASTSPAKYTPHGPGIMPNLWPSAQADQERALSPVGRTKVCAGYRTRAESAAKRAQIEGHAQTLPVSSTVPVEECGAANGPRAMVLGTPSGLHALSEAAATALHLPVPPPVRGGPPLLPAAEDPAGGSQQHASEIAGGGG